ncbi:MAG: selenium metabolism-associated LysR family transcriptional regulator [Pseudomonadota bacterium]
MDLWQLHVFCKVVEHSSFSMAANIVHLSQPTVSSHIKDLEDHLGCRLLDRLPKKVVPTKAGELLYTFACRLLALRDEAESALSTFQGTIKGELLIGGSTIPGVYILPKVMGAFSKTYPDVKICLEMGDTEKIIEATLMGRLELGVVGAKSDDHRIMQEPLLEDDLQLVVPADHRWAQKKSILLSQLKKEPFITREPGSGTLKSIQLRLAKKGCRIEDFKITAQMGSTEAIRQAIKNNIGVSILSRLAVSDDIETGRLATLEIQGVSFKRHFYLIRARHRTPSPAGRVFIDFLLSRKLESSDNESLHKGG